MIRAFERRFHDLAGELGGNKIQALIQLGSIEALEKEIDQIAKKHENLAVKLDNTRDIDYIRVDYQEYNVPTIIRRWKTGLLNRKQEIIKEDKLKDKKDKVLNDDMKTMAAKENIQIKLRGPSNFLAWMENIFSLTQKLPESTSDLKILSIIKNSIRNKYYLREVKEINSVDVMMKFLNSKYLSSPSLLSDSLKPLRDCKDPWTRNVSISNIHLSLNLYSRLKAVNMDMKIKTTHLALFEQKTLMSERRAKYYEQ